MVTVVIERPEAPASSSRIDPEVVSKDDVEMLQDMILAAVNDAHRKVDEALQKQMSGHDGRHGAARACAERARDLPNPSPGSSTNCSGCPASAPRAPSGWRSTC